MTNVAEGHPAHIAKEDQKVIKEKKKESDLSSEEIEEVLELKRKEKKTLMEKAKIVIYDNM